MAKYKYDTYHIDSFGGGSNIYLKLITCEDKIFILSILQSYALNWCHEYLLHPVMDRTEAMNRQNLYWPGVRETFCKEVKNCGTYHRKKRLNKKDDKLPAGEILFKKLRLYLIVPYTI